MEILRWFNKISGLDINQDKTRVTEIGPSRDRRIKLEGEFGLEWSYSFDVLDIHYNVYRLSEIIDKDLHLKINDIKELIRTWSTRKLRHYGKVTTCIVKSLLLSKFTHILLCLSSPNLQMFQSIESLFLSYIWYDKPPKFSKSILEAEIKDGGVR